MKFFRRLCSHACLYWCCDPLIFSVRLTSVLCLCLQSSKMAASKKTQKSLSSFFSSHTTSKYKMSASSEPSESVHPVCDSTIRTEAVSQKWVRPLASYAIFSVLCVCNTQFLKSECDPWLMDGMQHSPLLCTKSKLLVSVDCPCLVLVLSQKGHTVA